MTLFAPFLEHPHTTVLVVCAIMAALFPLVSRSPE